MIQPLLACLKCRKTLTIHLSIQKWVGVCGMRIGFMQKPVTVWRWSDLPV